MSDITLSRGIRSNLLSLQNTADLISRTQSRLSTGKKVNSALDNPTNFFTASALNSRANDLSNLLDNLSNGIKTLEAADNGLKAITRTVESLQSTLRQTRQDKSFKSTSFDFAAGGQADGKTITFTGGAFAAAATVTLDLAAGATATAATITGGAFAAATLDNAGDSIAVTLSIDGGAAQTVTITNAIASGINGGVLDNAARFSQALNAAIAANANTAGKVTAADDGTGKVQLTTTATGAASSLEITAVTPTDGGGANTLATAGGLAVAAEVTGGDANTVDSIVAQINANAALSGKVRVTNDNGKVRVENLSTADLAIGGTALTGGTIGGNTTRKDLRAQFNELRNQLDKLSDDAGFNGINLLRGDKLKLNFNETGTSAIEIQAKDSSGTVREINAAKLGITAGTDAEFESDSAIDSKLTALSDALGTLRSQASAFGSNLSIVQNRTEFTKSTINTLRTGADALTLADQNEEAANLLSLQTRQQLASTALSLANQADQSVLRLF